MTVYLYEFLIGFGVSYLFSLPPGMISLNVLQTTMQKGILNAFWLSLAAVIVEAIQAFIGVKFSAWINENESIKLFLQAFVIPVFLGFSIINLVTGIRTMRKKKQDEIKPSKTIGSFWKGLIVSALNPVAIPFWVVWATGISQKNLLILDLDHILIFVLGTTLGTLACLMTYAVLSAFIAKRIHAVKVWMNIIIGVLFLILAIIQTISILIKTLT
ncbi:MAG: LysE family translocator [Flavobacteriales bacterium]|nr:LysE family translocator [Flavobacteriales bacterium]